MTDRDETRPVARLREQLHHRGRLWLGKIEHWQAPLQTKNASDKGISHLMTFRTMGALELAHERKCS